LPAAAPPPSEEAAFTGGPDSVGQSSAPLLWAQVLGNAGLFVAIVPIARELGPSGRGTLAFITVTAIVGATLARFGVTEATTVRCAQQPRLRPVLLSNLILWVALATVTTAALLCAGLTLAPGLRPSGLGDAELVVLAAAVAASGLADAGYMFVLGCSRFRLHAAVTVATAWLYAASVVLVSLTMTLTVVMAGVIWVSFQLLKGLVLLAASARAEALGRPSVEALRAALAFGARAWVGTLSTAFNERADQILIAVIASEATLGLYATAVNGFEILLYPAAAAATAILPLAARAYPERRAQQVLGAFRSVALLTLAGALVAAAIGPWLFPVVFGSAFEASAAPFLWLLPGALGFVALAIFSNALVAASAPGLSSYGPLVSLAVALVLDFALIPPFGATGAAAAATTGLLAGGATALVLYRRIAGFPPTALVAPERRDLELLRALMRPFARGGAGRRSRRGVRG
jgi:O-antigen/teichoic acid export membrane protein